MCLQDDLVSEYEEGVSVDYVLLKSGLEQLDRQSSFLSPVFPFSLIDQHFKEQTKNLSENKTRPSSTSGIGGPKLRHGVDLGSI